MSYYLSVAHLGAGQCHLMTARAEEAVISLREALRLSMSILTTLPKLCDNSSQIKNQIPQYDLQFISLFNLQKDLSSANGNTTSLFLEAQLQSISQQACDVNCNDDNLAPMASSLFVQACKALFSVLHAHQRADDSLSLLDDAISGIEQCRQLLSGGADQSELIQESLYFLLIQAYLLETSKCIEQDRLLAAYEAIFKEGEVVAAIGLHRDALTLFKLCGEFYMKQSRISPFVLDDKILHTDNYEFSDYGARAAEVFLVATKECSKCIMHATTKLSEDLDLAQPTLQTIHQLYIDLIRMHFWRGMCAISRGQAQRCYEHAHTCVQDYQRLVDDSARALD
jgi:hypothetical protein